MSASRALLPAVICVLLGAFAPAALGANTFAPRIGGAMGLVPPAGSQDIATGALTPVTYHAGGVMTGGRRSTRSSGLRRDSASTAPPGSE